MKKITFVLTFLLIILVVKICLADSYNYTPYVGAQYQYSYAKVMHKRPEYHSVGVYIGSDYSKYFGTEVFYNQSGGRAKNYAGNKFRSSFRAYGLDMFVYLPMGCEQRFSLLGTAGVGEYVFKLKPANRKHHHENAKAYRFGGGFKYAINNHWQARFVARYVDFDKVNKVKQSMEYALSAEYHF